MENNKEKSEKVEGDHKYIYLPVEIHTHIKSYLTPHDWNNYDLAFEGLFIPNPPMPSPFEGLLKHSQWLMYLKDDDDDLSSCCCCFFKHPLYEESHSLGQVPQLLSGSVIRTAKYGWLLMSRAYRDDSLFFYNPFTEAVIELPPLPRSYYCQGITFSSPPTSADCVVFGVHGWAESYIDITSIHRGQQTWTRLEIDYDTPFYPSIDCSPVFCNGVFYCLGVDGNLGVYDPIEANWTILGDSMQPTLSKLMYHGFLLEFEGQLLSVYISKTGTNLSVFSLDDSVLPLMWKEVASLGDQMLFLSQTACVVAKARVREMENKIYFTRLRVPKYEEAAEDSRELVVCYSLENSRYETSGSDGWASKNFCNWKQYLNCTWIERAIENHSIEELDWLSNDPIFNMAPLDKDLS